MIIIGLRQKEKKKRSVKTRMENGKESDSERERERERERGARENFTKRKRICCLLEICAVLRFYFNCFVVLGGVGFGRWLVLLVAVVVSPS
jgi:hypothetical protein